MNNQLDAIEHLVGLMLENRSFDHRLDVLYADRPTRLQQRPQAGPLDNKN